MNNLLSPKHSPVNHVCQI